MTGGSAFPLVGDLHQFHGLGMTLRDYFAAKAMHAFLVELYFAPPDDLQKIAVLAYRQADAMLEARKS